MNVLFHVTFAALVQFPCILTHFSVETIFREERKERDVVMECTKRVEVFQREESANRIMRGIGEESVTHIQCCRSSLVIA